MCTLHPPNLTNQEKIQAFWLNPQKPNQSNSAIRLRSRVDSHLVSDAEESQISKPILGGDLNK